MTLYHDHLKYVRECTDRALAETGFDHVVIAAGALHVAFLDDNTYPFRANPHFKWWVPIVDNPNCLIVYTPGEKPRLVYYQPVDYWYKPAGAPRGFWVDSFDIRVIGDAKEAEQHLPKSGSIAYIAENGAPASAGPSEKPAKPGAPNPEPLLHRLHWARAWKTDYEIDCMRRANARAARGHVAAERAFREGQSEYEIHLTYLRAADHTEEELPYSNIIALNENASVLHYILHERNHLEDSSRHSFLIDAGASVNGYASDVTRTYSKTKDEFQELVDAMDQAQQSLVAAVKPNIAYPDIHMLAHRRVAELLVRFQFVRDLDAEAIVDKRISSAFLPHGVGHYLGLQVHDVGGFLADPTGNTIPKPEGHPYLRLTRKIEPRMVFTIEPGFYFIESLLADLRKSDDAKYVDWSTVDRFRKFGGVRIEDDVVVTAGGSENLTRDAFAALS